jgi:hypothetical protein
LLLPGFEEADHVCDAEWALVGLAFGGVDPAEVGVAVELGEGVEEQRRSGVGAEGGGDVVGEVAALGSFGFDVDGDGVTDREAAVALPGGADSEPVAVAGWFDRRWRVPASR